MGLADRDYMRKQPPKRGARGGGVTWWKRWKFAVWSWWRGRRKS